MVEQKDRSDNIDLVNNNLRLILSSNSYHLAHEDIELLNTSEMRGVRMLLEISKPEQILEKEEIISTIIVFGGSNITDKVSVKKKLEKTLRELEKAPRSTLLKRERDRLKILNSMSHYYDSAREFSRIVSRKNQTQEYCSNVIVTGGGPGIMEAANRGAFDADCKSIGLNINIPKEQYPNSFITPGLCFKFNYFALRKIHFVMRSTAAVFFPGGFGTLDELFELLTLRQTGMKKVIPIILFGREYWSRAINFQLLADSGLIDDNHLKLFQYADNALEAWEIIKRNLPTK